MSSAVTSKGQVTIPKPIRDELHLQAGDRIEFVRHPDGSVRVEAVTCSVKDLQGMLPRPNKSLSLEEMDQAIAEGAARR